MRADLREFNVLPCLIGIARPLEITLDRIHALVSTDRRVIRFVRRDGSFGARRCRRTRSHVCGVLTIPPRPKSHETPSSFRSLETVCELLRSSPATGVPPPQPRDGAQRHSAD